ncbi:MAG: hypothetical protein KAT07_04835, partial [Calditrichia bacterium]|nr:hypothetical protein [Calditrichia bacterium]
LANLETVTGPDELYNVYEKWNAAKQDVLEYEPHVTTAARVAAAGSNPESNAMSLAGKYWKQITEIIGGATILAGCTDDDDGTETDIKEPGSYLIKKSIELFGGDPESENKVNAYLDSVIEETSGVPVFEVTRMDYIEEAGIKPSGIIQPTRMPTIESAYEHALNADKLAMDMLIKYLNDGDMGDRNIEDLIDDKSREIIQDIKEDNVNIVHYAITMSKHDQNGVKYLKNEFETEDGEYGHILMEVVNMGNKENPNWVPSKIMDYQIYPEYIPLSANPEDFVTPDGNYKMLEKSTIKLGWGFMSNGGDDDHFLNENKADIGSGVVYDGKNLFQITFYNEKAFKDSNKVMDTSMTGRTENPDDLIKDTDDAEWTNEWALIDSDPKAHDKFYYKITQLTPRVDSVARKIDIGDDEIATGVFKLEDEGA